MPRAKKLKPAGENGAITLLEIAAALREGVDAWPPHHYTSDIGHRCSLAECLAALGQPEECDALIARGRQDCWHYHRFRGRYAVAIQLHRQGEVAAARARITVIDADVAASGAYGETLCVARGASASAWHALGEEARWRGALAEAHEAAQSERSNPTQPWPHLGQAYALCGELEAAIQTWSHGSAFREVMLCQIAEQAIARGQPEVIGRALQTAMLGGYKYGEVFARLLSQLRVHRDHSLLDILAPLFLRQGREEVFGELFDVWWRAGHRDDARAVAAHFAAHRAEPIGATLQALCGNTAPGEALSAELPKHAHRSNVWAELLGALGDGERARTLAAESRVPLVMLCSSAERAAMAGHTALAERLIAEADARVPEAEPEMMGHIARSLARCGQAAEAKRCFDAARKAAAALKGERRTGALEQLIERHREAGDLPGGQATATKLRIGNTRDRALSRLVDTALYAGDRAAAVVLMRSMKKVDEKVKVANRILRYAMNTDGRLAPASIQIGDFWAMI